MPENAPRSPLPARMRRAGRPMQIVIYPDHDNSWRHAVYHERPGIVDGRLRDTEGASAGIARAAACTMVRNLCAEYYGTDAEIDWEPADAKGMMSGRIRHTARPDSGRR